MYRTNCIGLAKLSIFPLIISITILTGCTVIRTEIDVPIQVNGKTFKEGETGINAVLTKLGPPGKISALGDNSVVFLYEYVSIKEQQVGVSLPGDILKWFKLSVAKAKADRQALLLTFDGKGVLRSREFHAFEEDLGSGFGLSFLYSIVTLVDYSRLEKQPEILNWGAGLLEPLPEALNTMHSFDNGLRGVEQKGTPTSVGQRTLEMRETNLKR